MKTRDLRIYAWMGFVLFNFFIGFTYILSMILSLGLSVVIAIAGTLFSFYFFEEFYQKSDKSVSPGEIDPIDPENISGNLMNEPVFYHPKECERCKHFNSNPWNGTKPSVSYCLGFGEFAQRQVVRRDMEEFTPCPKFKQK